MEKPVTKTSSVSFQTLLTFITAAVWFINGFFCKVLNLVPRHQLIVARILGTEHSLLFTKTIGGLEVLMAVWILSRIQRRLCVITQIILVAVMNTIEALLVPDLLLFGKGNALFAAMFIALLYWSEFKSNCKTLLSIKT